MDAFAQLMTLQNKLPAKTRIPGDAGKLSDEDVEFAFYETQHGTLTALAAKAAELFKAAAGDPRRPAWCQDNMQTPTDVPSRRKLLNTLRVLKAEEVPVRAEEALPDRVERLMPDGRYTVVFGDPDDYLTLRLQDAGWAKQPSQPAGGQSVGLLTGPDNWSNYKHVGFLWGDHWKPSSWSSMEGRMAQAIEILTGDWHLAGEAYAMKSGRCHVCRRLLTQPASLHRGMGEECWSKHAG